jgi:hypothetical protein
MRARIAVSIVSRLRAEWPQNCGWIRRRGREFSLLHSTKTRYRAHQVSYPMVQRAVSMGMKWLACKVHHSCLSSTEMNEAKNYFKVAHPHCIIKCKCILQSVSTTLYSGRIRLKMISHHQAQLQEFVRGYILQLYFRFNISTFTI